MATLEPTGSQGEPEHVGCSGSWHVSRPPQHLFASVVQKPYSDLGVCLVLAAQRSSVLVRVDLSEMVCCDTEVELKLVCIHWVYLVTMMLVLSDLTVASAFPCSVGTLGTR